MTVCRDSLAISMKKVLFVCTGNTCRSPMAQALFNKICETEGLDFIADSCGIYADGFSPVSDNAKLALKNVGIEFNHISQPLSNKMASEADYIFGITDSHARTLMDIFPECSEKIYRFPLDISDPYGANLDVYENCLKEIEAGVRHIITKLSENKDDK